mmetsp:Transcript_12323/g.18486  ORF Transcript_12323/g.18486 Transcript_12323/m.18486 type:complete len:182 (-) Transcript_12323:215-760(-)
MEGAKIEPEVKGDIYKQKELEYIFQSARETGMGAQQNSSTKLTDNAGGAFSFGFAFPDEKAAQDEIFHDGHVGDSTVATDAASEKPLTGDASILSDEKLPDRQYPKRRRGMFHFIPSDVLDELEESFFTLLDTDTILSEVDEKEKWFQERKSLTLDWKRKHKKASKKIGPLQMRKRKFSRR